MLQKILTDPDVPLFYYHLKNLEKAFPSLKQATNDDLVCAIIISRSLHKNKKNPLHKIISKANKDLQSSKDYDVDILLLLSFLIRKPIGDRIGYAHYINELKFGVGPPETPLDITNWKNNKILIDFLVKNGAKRTCSISSQNNFEGILEKLKNKAPDVKDKLIIIYLSHQTFHSLSNDTISQITETFHIAYLDLSNSDLSSVDLSPLTKMVNLQGINLARCSITHLPKEIENLTKLKRINLATNNLSQANLTILTAITSLEHLTIVNCNIRQLPGQLENMPKLETLYEGGNHLDTPSKALISRLQDSHIASSISSHYFY